MTESIILPVEDAERIADLLQQVDDEKAEFYAELLEDHAENHSFDSRFEEVGPIEEFLAENQTADEL